MPKTTTPQSWMRRHYNFYNTIPGKFPIGSPRSANASFIAILRRSSSPFSRTVKRVSCVRPFHFLIVHLYPTFLICRRMCNKKCKILRHISSRDSGLAKFSFVCSAAPRMPSSILHPQNGHFIWLLFPSLTFLHLLSNIDKIAWMSMVARFSKLKVWK